jgi:hypothetical protein
MNNTLAIQKIRSRIEHLGSKLRLSYSVAECRQNDQTSRDRSVMEAVHLYKQIRRSEQAAGLLRAEDLAGKTERRLAAAAALRVETPAESVLVT